MLISFLLKRNQINEYINCIESLSGEIVEKNSKIELWTMKSLIFANILKLHIWCCLIKTKPDLKKIESKIEFFPSFNRMIYVSGHSDYSESFYYIEVKQF